MSQSMSDEISKLYPDVAAAGGLGKALQQALASEGAPFRATELDKVMNRFAYARVERGSRFSQVHIASQERLFMVAYWDRGVMLAQAGTPSLDELARTINFWVGTRCTTAALAADFPIVVPERQAIAYERGEEVAERWRDYLEHMGEWLPELVEFVQVAAARPRLRQLFPFTSHSTFCFSRCTGYPFTRDTPNVRPRSDGTYAVYGPDEGLLGWGSADIAADLVVQHLPAACGPAVAGTAEDLLQR